MAETSMLNGQFVQGDDPCWSSLEAVLGTELAASFMWMCEVRLEDGRRIDAYKHTASRKYLHLSEAGSAFRYNATGSYVGVDVESAITSAFEGFGTLPEAGVG